MAAYREIGLPTCNTLFYFLSLLRNNRFDKMTSTLELFNVGLVLSPKMSISSVDGVGGLVVERPL